MELFQNFIKSEQINFKLMIFFNSNHEKQMHEFFIKVIILIIHIVWFLNQLNFYMIQLILNLNQNLFIQLSFNIIILNDFYIIL